MTFTAAQVGPTDLITGTEPPPADSAEAGTPARRGQALQTSLLLPPGE